MQLSWLQTFMAVYHTGSITKAARQLGMSQPSVTQQIRSMELEIGHRLFERTTRGTVPTPRGTVLAQDVCESIVELNAAIDRHFTPAAGDRPLRLGATAELASTRVIPPVAGLVASGTDVRIQTGVSHELLSRLGEGFLDMVISTIRPRRRGIEATPLCDEELVLVASPQLAEEAFAGGIAEFGDSRLEKVPLIAYAETLPLVTQYWRHVFGTEPDVHVGAVVPDLRGILAAVTAGAGIAVLPRCLSHMALETGEVVTLLEPEEPPINTLYLAVRNGALQDYRLSLLHTELLRCAQHWV
ncbi:MULTISPECIES: LysR family transcriptional regulator [unclassified Streptomyces]|uniref:LysR family transcriptional regulator n=1 Tax=unclassified Streptomyces TaxID=2593676 RepID=UPI0033C00836|nr:LysR family transcriptional regulator [Streptomyces polychromogenes]